MTKFCGKPYEKMGCMHKVSVIAFVALICNSLCSMFTISSNQHSVVPPQSTSEAEPCELVISDQSHTGKKVEQNGISLQTHLLWSNRMDNMNRLWCESKI
jgi:hypothetical protein